MRQGKYENRESEENKEPDCNREPVIEHFHRVAAHKEGKRTLYQEAVLQAYGITPVEGCFSSFQRKREQADVSIKWSTASSMSKQSLLAF